MTEDERKMLVETASAWKTNARLFREMGKNCCEHLRYGHESIAITFEQNAKIVEATAKSPNPKTDLYRDVFPERQE